MLATKTRVRFFLWIRAALTKRPQLGSSFHYQVLRMKLCGMRVVVVSGSECGAYVSAIPETLPWLLCVTVLCSTEPKHK